MKSGQFDPVSGLGLVDIEWGRATLRAMVENAGRKTWMKNAPEDELLKLACVVARLADRKAQVYANPVDEPAKAAFGWIIKDPELSWMTRQIDFALLELSHIPIRMLDSTLQSQECQTDEADRSGRSMSLF